MCYRQKEEGTVEIPLTEYNRIKDELFSAEEEILKQRKALEAIENEPDNSVVIKTCYPYQWIYGQTSYSVISKDEFVLNKTKELVSLKEELLVSEKELHELKLEIEKTPKWIRRIFN